MAEPDGDNPVVKSVTYPSVIGNSGPNPIINQPSVLAPKDGAGSGDIRYLKSDTITAIEGGGITTCQTDTIQSVDNSVLLDTSQTSDFADPENAFDNDGSHYPWVGSYFTSANNST